MINLKTAKIIGGLLTGVVGVTTGLAYSMGVFHIVKKETKEFIEILDEENKFKLLSTTDGEDIQDWKTNWTAYKNDNSNDQNDKWAVVGWAKTGVEDTPKGFKDSCNNRKANKAVDKSSLEYKDFVKYCTKAKTIKEALEKFGFRSLAQENQDQEWTKRLSNYKQSNNQLPKAKIASSDSTNTFEFLKNGCKVALEIKTTDDDYEQTAKAVKEWCDEGAK